MDGWWSKSGRFDLQLLQQVVRVVDKWTLWPWDTHHELCVDDVAVVVVSRSGSSPQIASFCVVREGGVGGKQSWTILMIIDLNHFRSFFVLACRIE